MSKKAIFEVATLADAVAKAFRIAPTKGAAFDKASGIYVEIDPNNLLEGVVIKSTDLDVTYRQHVSHLELGDEACTWRVHARLFHDMMSQLPMGMGNTVQLQQITGPKADGYLYFICGKIKAKLQLIQGEFPNVAKYDQDDLDVVPNLSKRLAQVAWAADYKAQSTLAGIHIDGEFLIATNRQVLAMVPCPVPVTAPVTAQLTDISALIKNTSEVQMRADDTHMRISPDAWTQTTCVLYAGEFPNIRKLLDTTRPKFNGKLVVECEPLKNALARTLVMVKAERYPRTTVEIGNGTMKLTVEVPEVGKIADEVECQGGQADGKEPFTFTFSPENLRDAIEASGRMSVTMLYGPTPLSPIMLVDDNGFEALMMPMQTPTSNG